MSYSLDVPDGFVFVGADESLLLAEYRVNAWSLTGADWRVVELAPADEPTVYHDYATEGGRAYVRNALLASRGFGCIGAGCPSSDHNNGDRDYTPHCDKTCEVPPVRQHPEGEACKRHWHKSDA